MKNLKNLILGLIMILSIPQISYTQIDGITFQARTVVLNSDHTESRESSEIFSVSINDSILVHHPMENNRVTETQIYRLVFFDFDVLTDDNTGKTYAVVDFSAMSGMTKIVYSYRIIIDEDDSAIFQTNVGVSFVGRVTDVTGFKR